MTRPTVLVVCLCLGLSACGMLKTKEEAPTAPATPVTPAGPKPPSKGDPQQRFSAALDMHRKNQIQEAEQAFVALTKDFPQFSGPFTNLGILYAKSNRRPQALAALNQAVLLNRDNAVAYNWLGIEYREANDLMRAKAAYEKALSLKSDYALAHYNYAILLDEHLKRPGEALPHYKDYMRLSGKQDLKVMAWVAEIEQRSAGAPARPTAPAPIAAPGAPVAKPVPSRVEGPAAPAPAEPAKKEKKLSTFDDGTER
ncbi:MAG TPA: tetratricopeptide repeat protein [Solimonas sp.]|nr:tetratricopeptide repeat protein [Solimonas sp.]